jgi:hypothetical protein
MGGTSVVDGGTLATPRCAVAGLSDEAPVKAAQCRCGQAAASDAVASCQGALEKWSKRGSAQGGRRAARVGAAAASALVRFGRSRWREENRGEEGIRLGVVRVALSLEAGRQ